jgi:DNA polymerase I-like protein with 3'-5' exonuclease and polymerase domains
MNLYLDIETNKKHDKIWCCFTWDEKNGSVCHTEPTTLAPLIASSDKVIAHNLIGFDAVVLRNCWKIAIPAKKAIDTLILSRLYNPSLDGGHSLEAWGKRLGNNKIDYPQAFFDKWAPQFADGLLPSDLNCWDNPDIELMFPYCEQDVSLLVDVHKHLMGLLKPFSEESIELEHQVAVIIQKQKEHGFKLDIPKAQGMLAMLQGKMVDIETELQKVFPPIIEKRVSEKTGKPLKDKIVIFNPGSRQQIADRLATLGVVFTKKTEKGSIIVDEKVLESIDKPEAKLLSEYLMLQKRVAQIGSWLEVVDDGGRVHGSVITNGAVTGRMTHSSPNMAQVPNSGSPYGKECRDLWVVDSNNFLVGIDASGLELRMLAHYMKDEAYVKTVCEGSSKDGTDVHTINQKAAGLPTRDAAKTFIYAFLYGAGAAKIGSIVGADASAGTKLINKFLSATPALQILRDTVATHANKGCVPGLDGRKIWVRSEHSALNTLLQGAGAIVMKKALVLLDEKLRKKKVWYGFCANVHDEWQIETKPETAELVGQLGVQSIQEAGEWFKLRCPLSGEYHIGKTWKDTH